MTTWYRSRGLRPGGLLGLRWRDQKLDGESPTVRVRTSLKRTGTTLSLGELKTPLSNRELVLPLSVATELRRHKRSQARSRLAVGEVWEDLDLVFANEIGSSTDPANLRRSLAKRCVVAGIERITPYELRHSAVSPLSDGGVPIEHLADLAGHKDARTTMPVYRHQLSPVVDGGSQIAEDVILSRTGNGAD